jgi:hypothetical protein
MHVIFYTIILLRTTEFWSLSIVRSYKNQRILRFGNWICFRPQVSERGGGPPSLFAPLERTNHNQWTTYVSITTN